MTIFFSFQLGRGGDGFKQEQFTALSVVADFTRQLETLYSIKHLLICVCGPTYAVCHCSRVGRGRCIKDFYMQNLYGAISKKKTLC